MKARQTGPRLPVIELGSGARLRPMRRTDGAALFLQIEINRSRLRAWFPWVDSTTSPEALDGFLLESVRRNRIGSAARYVIEIDGTVAGLVGLEVINDRHQNASIGYWIAAAFEGHGWVSRATHALCNYAFVQRGLHRIEIRAMPNNHRSRAIPERLGFQQEGAARQAQKLHGSFFDLEVYSMLRPEWTALEAKR